MLESKFEIEQARLEHIPAAALMIQALFAEEQEPLTEPMKDAIRAYLLQSLADPMSILLIASVIKHKKKRPVGVGLLVVSPSTYGVLVGWGNHLYIDPAYRKFDIGSQILGKAEELAKQLGAQRIQVETKQPGFFTKHGYKEDRVILTKVM